MYHVLLIWCFSALASYLLGSTLIRLTIKYKDAIIKKHPQMKDAILYIENNSSVMNKLYGVIGALFGPLGFLFIIYQCLKIKLTYKLN